MNSFREKLKDKKRIVIKIGSSSLTHERTGELNLFKIEKLIRVICDLKGEGKDVVLVSSGAIAAGRAGSGRPETPSDHFRKTGLRGGWSGTPDDGVPAYLF